MLTLNMTAFTIGIGSYSFPWAAGIPGFPQPQEPLSAAGLLQKASHLNVALLQICDNLPLHELASQEIDELRKQAAAPPARGFSNCRGS